MIDSDNKVSKSVIFFTLKIRKSLSQDCLGACKNDLKSKLLQGIDVTTPSLMVIFLESDLMWKLHGLRLYKLP